MVASVEFGYDDPDRERTHHLELVLVVFSFGANQTTRDQTELQMLKLCCQNWIEPDESVEGFCSDRLTLRFSVPFAAEAATFRFSMLRCPQKTLIHFHFSVCSSIWAEKFLEDFLKRFEEVFFFFLQV